MSQSPAQPDAATHEWRTKQARLQVFLDRHQLDAVLLWRRAAFAWITCGGDNRVVDGSETGFAGILATREGRWCLADAIEAPRMRDEQLADSEIDVIEFPWHDDVAARSRVSEFLNGAGLHPQRVAADVARPGFPFAPLPQGFERLRWQLTPAELERYREGGRLAAGAVEAAAKAVEPGMREHELSAVLDHFVRAAGLVPVVNLIATDERIFRYRHPIPTDRRLERYAMLVTCAGFRGLISNLTRFVHFGTVPEALELKQQAVADIDAAAIIATRPDRTLGEIFAEVQRAYAAAGFGEEWMLHHQGGSTGYSAREVVAKPGEGVRVLEDQAFAWNPSVSGAKSEDTILVTAQGFEVLTGHGVDWPTITGHAAGAELPRASCLVR